MEQGGETSKGGVMEEGLGCRRAGWQRDGVQGGCKFAGVQIGVQGGGWMGRDIKGSEKVGCKGVSLCKTESRGRGQHPDIT